MTRQSDLRAFLRSLDVDTLADLLCEQAERDPELRKRLLAQADGAEGGELAQVSDLLDSAVRTAESVQIASVLDTLQRLLDAGTRADVAPLARRAVDKITKALEDLDDPSGVVGDQLDRAVSLYARACAAHPPDPEELAGWILRVEFEGSGRPQLSLAEFATPLGERGLAKIKSTVERVLAERGAGAEPRRQLARRLNQELAEVTGDVDAVVRMLSEQLPRLDVSLKIVRVLRAAGRHAEAIAHAAKALGNDNGARRGPVVDALERARSPEPAEAVRLLLEQDRPGEAWEAAAGHPPSAVIGIYRQHIERLIETRDAERYAQAAKQLRRLRTLHRKAGTPDEFTAYVAELVETHKRKTRLLAELRNARIALPRTARSAAATRR
ncbi:hypothetical protein B0I33_105473 [Prauserella shujinwangii]|uniref:Uncharacterized protein n=1 Tax=Prauserella shujinwangii TaxID=1453103 RepID=A0A2T0LVU4_9PSEU|nr:DUF6880 family protein [Prauserella shujinwangii]PRX47889.1 hypothetical protein B0I33_105473 [Prauserella shujinwangii]